MYCVSILSIEHSPVSLNFNLNSKCKAEGLCSQLTWKINKMCVYFKYRAFVCFPFNFNWSVVNSAYFENNNKYRLLNYPDGGMLNADSNADFVKLYQPRSAYSASPYFKWMFTHKVQIYSVLTSSSLSIYNVCDNKEREDSFYEILYWEYTVVGDFILQNLYGTHE